ncbi:MAG: hypothetical protein FWG65_03915 [Turicibacter sp.]|nr:hypothetical protein [Turicibacter sp.]
MTCLFVDIDFMRFVGVVYLYAVLLSSATFIITSVQHFAHFLHKSSVMS